MITKENVENRFFEFLESSCNGTIDEETLESAITDMYERLTAEERDIVSEYLEDNMKYIMTWAIMKADGQDVPSMDYVRQQWMANKIH